MSIKKYTDWRTWWDGLRTNLIKCIGTTGTAWIGTNILGSTGLVKGIDWKSALEFFAGHMLVEVFLYLKENQPKVIVETSDTTFTSKPTDTK